MKRSQNPGLCSEHQENFVAINIDPSFDSFRHYCVQCLKNPNKQKNSRSYKEADEILQNQKKFFKCQKEIQNQQNLQTLETLSQTLANLKLEYMNLIDILLENIRCQADQILSSYQQFDQLLEDIDIESYLSFNHKYSENEFDFSGFQQQIQQQLEQLIDDRKITTCLQELQMINDQVIVLSPNHQVEEISQINPSFKLPKLSFQCEEHNQKMRLYDSNDRIPREKRILCEECASQREGTYIPLLKMYKIWLTQKDQIIGQLNTSSSETKTKINAIQREVNLLREEFSIVITSIDNDLEIFQKTIQQNCENHRSYLQKGWENLSKDEILTIVDSIQQQTQIQQSLDPEIQQHNTTLNQKIQKSIVNLQESYHLFVKRVNSVIECEKKTTARMQTIPKQTEQQPIPIQKQNKKRDLQLNIQSATIKLNLKIQKPIHYELIPELSIKQDEHCYAITFSHDQKFMLAVCGFDIKLFEFQQGRLTEKMLLKGHKNEVLALYFMKQSYSFISGGRDSQILFWTLKNDKYSFNILKGGHSRNVNCIIMNKNENLMVSCGDDNLIKFWDFIEEQWTCSITLTTPNNGSAIHSICFNQSENQLVSCGSDKVIIISENINQKWQIIQIIKLQVSCHRICFIKDDLIMFQPLNSEFIQIYKQNNDNKQFEQFKQVQVQKGSRCSMQFPIVYNTTKNLIVSKNSVRVNLFRVREDSDLILEQSIVFQKPIVYGALTRDGQYLVTWSDGVYKQFEVRVLQ